MILHFCKVCNFEQYGAFWFIPCNGCLMVLVMIFGGGGGGRMEVVGSEEIVRDLFTDQ